jgi:hypothetical protein
LGTVPFAWWLGQSYGPQGVLIGQAVGGIVFGVLAVWLALRVIDRRMLAMSEMVGIPSDTKFPLPPTGRLG